MQGRIVLVAIWWALSVAWPTHAISYSIRGATASAVSVGFSLDKFEIAHISEQSSFILAVSSSPTQTLSLRVQSDSFAYPRTVMPASLVHKGWAGSGFLQWFSFSPYRQTGKGLKTAIENGAITITAAGTGAVAGSKPYIKNSIVYLGTFTNLAKALATPQPGGIFTRGVKVSVEKDGIYQINGAALRKLGVPIATIPGTVYKLYNSGAQVPLYVSNNFHAVLQDNDVILFYGKFLRGSNTSLSQFSNTNVYWLTWEGIAPGIRVAEASGGQRKDATVYSQGTSTEILAHEFYDTLHLEQDNQVLFLGSVNAVSEMGDSSQNLDDNWYWGIIGASAITNFTIDVPSPTTSTDPSLTARLHIRFQGMSNVSSVSPNHRLYIYLNDNAPGGQEQIAEWDGQSKFDFVSSPFPSSLFQNDTNKITFSRVPKSSGQQLQTYPDLSALNWIEIEYYRNFVADKDHLLFKNSSSDVNGIYQFEVTGFSSGSFDLWDIGNFRLFTGFTVQSANAAGKPSYSLVFQDSLAAVHSFLAQTVSMRLAPARMSLDTIRRDWSGFAKADYVVVTVDSFFNDFRPFVNAYAKKGWTVALADISDVYNAFSGGIADPEAIRMFLQYLFSLSSAKHPRYLLLGGDTSYDLDKVNRGRNIVPTHLSGVPGWGPASDDGYFAAFLSDDDFPDINVGRFPAENRTELQNIVSKTVGYLTQRACGPWHDNLLLVGGAESDFTAFNDNTQTEVIGPTMNVYRLDGDPQSRYYHDQSNASSDLAGLINAGVYAINFDGHGGGLVWSDSRFFSYTDLDKLYNGQWDRAGRLPIVFSFTCLTADFESVDYQSLGEEFLRVKKNGCVGFFGASGYTSKRGNLIMNRLMLQNAVAGSFESVGDLLSYAKMNMLVRFGTEFTALVREYNLLGDPALPWALAPDSLRLTVEKTAMRPQDTLSVRGYCAPIQSGQARVTLGADFLTWNQFSWDVRSDSLRGVCPVRDSLRTSRGLVRAFAWNDTQELRGYSTFSKSTVLFRNVAVSPTPLRYGDSVNVSTTIEILDSSRKADAVLCLYSVIPRYVTNPSFQGTSMFADSTGTWRTNARIPIAFNGMVGDELLVKFRVIGNGFSDTTDVYSFTILGRPDLMFTPGGVTVVWRNDSLFAQCQVLNGGNASAPPFGVTFYLGLSAPATPIGTVLSTDSLLPGKTRFFSLALPDTQGTLQVTAIANQSGSFDEISRDNNTAHRSVRLVHADIATSADTLCAAGHTVCVSPLATLTPRRRIFLVADTIAAQHPLRTESYWTPLSDDSVSRFVAWLRPALSAADSLAWTFYRSPRDSTLPAAKRLASYPATARLRVLLFDSLLNVWRSEPGSSDSAKMKCVMHATRSGPFALGLLSDNQPPQIQASVDGRNLTFLDYAAKGKPFNLFLSDASGIVPSSVRVLLDKKSLDTALVSHIPVQSDLTQISCTAYPKKESNVDSLTVMAEDFAGNVAVTTFAFLPGEDLTIKNFSCHPNPFTAKQDNSGKTIQTIRFAFLLTDVAQSASIVVYTIGSRVAWSWQNNTGIIGYQEVPWDGKTSQGYRIANGTYYAKLSVKNGSKSATSIIRIAKLEGY